MIAIVVVLGLMASGFGPAGSAEAAAARDEGERARVVELAEANLPVDAVLATTDGSGLEVREPIGRPSDALTDAFSSRPDGFDPRSYVEAARRAIEWGWGVKVPDLEAVFQEVAAGGQGVEPISSTWRVGLPAGDLTGDGLDDALSLELTLDLESSVVSVVLRGPGVPTGPPSGPTT